MGLEERMGEAGRRQPAFNERLPRWRARVRAKTLFPMTGPSATFGFRDVEASGEGRAHAAACSYRVASALRPDERPDERGRPSSSNT